MISVPSDIYSVYGAPLNVIDVSIGHKEAIYKCPYCESVKGTPDRSGHLYVNLRTRAFSCKRCGTEGRISNQSNYKYEKDVSNEEILNLIRTMEEEPKGVQYTIPMCKAFEMKGAVSYLHSRGFTDEEISFYDMRVGGIFNKNMFGRIIIPNQVYNKVYTDMYVGRTYIDSPKRYLNPSGKNSSLSVFNLHRIEDNPERIIVCEGCLTAIAAGKDAVALYGKHCSKTQFNKILSKKPKEIVINLDPDAISESDELCKLFHSSSDAVIKQLILPEKFDAADYKSLGISYAYREMVEKCPVYNPLLRNISKIS